MPGHNTKQKSILLLETTIFGVFFGVFFSLCYELTRPIPVPPDLLQSYFEEGKERAVNVFFDCLARVSQELPSSSEITVSAQNAKWLVCAEKVSYTTTINLPDEKLFLTFSNVQIGIVATSLALLIFYFACRIKNLLEKRNQKVKFTPPYARAA